MTPQAIPSITHRLSRLKPMGYPIKNPWDIPIKTQKKPMGYPNGNPRGIPMETQGVSRSKPVENPLLSHGLSMGNPLKTDKRREEKRREDIYLPGRDSRIYLPTGGVG